MMKVLIVDDDNLVSLSLKTILEASGEVTIAGIGNSGEQAIELYEEHQPDILLMDIRMEGMTGLTAGKKILAKYPNARILFLTTFADDEYIVKALHMGAKGYLLKQNKDALNSLPKEAKIFGFGFAFVTWISFMKNFQSFWLVHCDIGRGMVDIFGCICACAMVILISRVIEEKLSFIGKPLAYFGKYSLLILCVHIVELDLFPWWRIAWKLVQHNILPATYLSQLVSVIAGKLIIDLGLAFILSKIPLARKAFGFRN